MGEKFIYYISTHNIELIIGAIFCLLVVVLSILSSAKKNNPAISSTSSISQMINIVLVQQSQHNYYVKREYSREQIKDVNVENSNDDFYVFLFICLFLASVYAKFHSQIMTAILLYSLLILLFITIIAVQLSRNNQLDGLNAHWLKVSIGIIFYNFFSLYMMFNQNIEIGKGITELTRILTYFIGLVLQVIPNIFILIIFIYLLSLNTFLITPNKFNAYLVRKLHRFTDRHKKTTWIIAIILFFALIFSSGAYNKLTDFLIQFDSTQIQ